MSDMPHKSWFDKFYVLSELLCKKIELGTELFMKRVLALRNGDYAKALFIEQMYLKPTDEQVKILAKNIFDLVEEIQNGRKNNNRGRNS